MSFTLRQIAMASLLAARPHGSTHPTNRIPSSVDENADWARNGLAIDKRAGPELRKIGARLDHVVNRTNKSMTRERKVIRIQEIADRAFALIKPNTPCRSGCSHCCHIAVGISETEARIISKHIGRAYVAQPSAAGDSYDALEHNITRYRSTPCTFLVDGPVTGEKVCSIYQVRPLACRTHHSLAATAANCDVSAGIQDVPMIDLKSISVAGVMVGRGEAFGDIRAFFPSEDEGDPRTPEYGVGT